MKKRIKLPLFFLLLILAGFACRPNPSHLDDAARIAKQYSDDIARIAKNYTDDVAKSTNKIKPLSDEALATTKFQPMQTINWAGRAIKSRYTQEQIVEVTNLIVKKTKPANILGPDGSVLFTLPGESGTWALLDGKIYKSAQNYKELDQLFSQRHFEITRSILDHIDSYKVFPDEMDLVVRKSINATKGIAQKATEVQYNPQSRELTISYAMHQRTYNMGNLFFDGLGSTGLMVGIGKYYTIGF